MSYPKWVQRAPEIGAVLCLNADEEKKLLDDWVKNPKQAEKELKAENEKTIEELRQLAESLGIRVDARWGVQRLQEEIAAKAEK